MTYLVNKKMYDAIASRVNNNDLKISGSPMKMTLMEWMCNYFNDGLNLPKRTITAIQFNS